MVLIPRHEAKFIQKIVEEISLELRSINLSMDEKLIGMDTRIKDVESSLEIDFKDVRMIGIKGIGGGGKTTLARSVFDQISIHFEGKSFVENVREVSKGSLFGLMLLQKQVLSDVLKNNQDIVVNSVHDGKRMMKMSLRGKKVLLVLDDVDDISQLEALAGEPSWFKPGSRIIITTRDEQVLIAHRVSLIHDVNLFSDVEAIRLLSRYAFGKEIPNQGHEELSRQVVRYAGGLPLTIRVLGSFLCCKNKLEWKDALERLNTIPLQETLEKLELSYIGLEKDYKEIFLDVACLLKGWWKEDAIIMLESCGFHARIGLRVLEQKSLINVDGGFIGMHDHIEEMGRNIVRRDHPDEPSKHSRLWIQEEIEDVLANDLGTQATRCIQLSVMGSLPKVFIKGFGRMNKLRALHVSFECDGDGFCSDWKFDEASQYFPNALQYLYWVRYPYRSLPNMFGANNLVALHLSESRIVQLWERGETKALKNLRYLDLSFSELTTLDLGLTPNLEVLKLENCHNLLELHMPLGHPKLRSLKVSHSKLETLKLGLTLNLKELSLRECHSLVRLDTPIGGLEELACLNLSGCAGFESFVLTKQLESFKFHRRTESLDIFLLESYHSLPNFRFSCVYEEQPSSYTGNVGKLISLCLSRCTNLQRLLDNVCQLRNIIQLTLEGSISEAPKDIDQLECLDEVFLLSIEIRHLPDSICMLKYLKYIKLESCWLLEKLPEDIGQLECLEKLHLWGTCIKRLPDGICKLKHLKSLELQSCGLLEKLPRDLGRLESLESLSLVSTCIKHVPDSICMLKKLKYLKLKRCVNLEKLPNDIGQLESLEDLCLVGMHIKHLPDSICMLKHLKSLILEACWLLEKLPEDLGRLVYLEELILTECTCLQGIPNDICKMKYLKCFRLPYCTHVEKLPEELGDLKCLLELDIVGTGIRQLPQSIVMLKGLRVVGFRWALQLFGFTSKMQTSEDITSCYM